ncbi:DUF4135 domain-containing protein [Thalassospiraceae bacterium LMO-JJ14]|nr:DUF4135 domain-containing protein [Thalassospiraceae bacterium LMO-JJ14]
MRARYTTAITPEGWQCPYQLRVSGFNETDTRDFIRNDLISIVAPTLHAPTGTAINETGNGPLTLDFGCLNEVVERRYCDLGKALRKSALACTEATCISSFPALKSFKPLADDSHQGGARPLLLSGDATSLVLKHADPRPYRCLADILSQVSTGLQTDLRMPEIISSPSNDWYFIPYLTTTSRATNQPKPFMYAVGILTAVAYALRIVGLHMENIVIHGQRPVIIDPECIFSNFAPVTT